MPYNDLSNMRMPNMRDIMAAVKARREMRARGAQGAIAARDAVGAPAQVQLPGEAAIEAQPISGGQRSGLAQRHNELVAQGMDSEQAMQQLIQEGRLDPRMAQMLMRAPRAAGQVGY